MVMWTWQDEIGARNNAGVEFTDTVKHPDPYTYDPNKPQQGGMFIDSVRYQDPYAVYPNGTGYQGWTYPVRDNPFNPPPLERGSRQPDFPAIHPFDQEKNVELSKIGPFDWSSLGREALIPQSIQKKELRFTISAFPTPNNKRDNIVFIYLWNGKDWVWDGNKDDIIGALERYPLKQWRWSSVDE